ncbi:MAG: hypothetical protein GEU89_13155 [Kiloniellaceae bacterium]|nr:hypothetical protein [Kiloniellaceae bacterium]
MLAVLQWIYGPQAASDPAYQLLHDFVVLMPWWYPYMWLCILTSVASWRLLRRWQRARQSRVGLRRVHSRVRRLAADPAARSSLAPFVPQAANDDLPPAIARRRAAD